MNVSLIDADEELSYPELKERVGLADEDLMRAMHSLSCSKYKVLLKEPAGKTISKGDKFKLNLDFTDKSRRIKVGPDMSQQHYMVLSLRQAQC